MSQFPLNASSKKIPDTRMFARMCQICGKPLPVETAKADADGKTIHEECYALKVELEDASQDGHANVTRPWKVIAAEVSREQDPKKMTELVSELNQALDEQKIDGTPKVKPDATRKPNSE